jgi:signal transduction histidine kinase
LLIALGAVVLTALPVFTHFRFFYRSEALRVFLETIQAVVAVLVALLLYGRYRRSALCGDLLAAYGLFVLGSANVFVALLPVYGVLPPRRSFDGFSTWVPLVARILGALALAGAALLPRRWLRLRRPVQAMGAALGASLGGVVLLVTATSRWLPGGVPGEFLPDGWPRPELHAPGALLVAELVLMAVFAVAAAGFARQARGSWNPLMTALTCGCVLAAFARFNFFLHLPSGTDLVHVGDLLCLLSFLVLLAGATAEIAGYWQAQAEMAAARERQRLACELHDGLAQELAFIRSHTATLARGAGHPGVSALVAEAAERASSESRRVVATLRSGSAPLDQLLQEAAGGVVRRAGVRMSVAVDAEVWLPEAVHPEVASLVRRATDAAVRVRAASTVTVRLGMRDGRTVLSVRDDGPGAKYLGAEEAFRQDLQQRAGALGGSCRAVSQRGGGTQVDIVLPWQHGRRSGRWSGRVEAG